VYQSFEKERLEGVHCLTCWLDRFLDSIEASSLTAEEKKQIAEAVNDIRSLAGCDLDEASSFGSRRGPSARAVPGAP